jgi:hypothetical protein
VLAPNDDQVRPVAHVGRRPPPMPPT